MSSSKSLPTFPAFDGREASLASADPHIGALRTHHQQRWREARRTLDRSRRCSAEVAVAAVRRLVVVAHQLATIERCACRCAATESVLSSTLSRLLSMAADPELPPALRIAAAAAAEPCAEDLASLYDDHGLDGHADCARRVIRVAQRTAAAAMS